MSIRTEKVASLIKHELGTIISREFTGSEYGFITVTEVRMTPDLKIAKIYISILGNAELQEKSFKKLLTQKKYLRSLLAPHLTLKFTPDIQLHYDDSMERVEHLEKLIQQIHKDDKGAE